MGEHMVCPWSREDLSKVESLLVTSWRIHRPDPTAPCSHYPRGQVFFEVVKCWHEVILDSTILTVR